MTARGDRRENIYDDTDREKFLAILGQVIENFNRVYDHFQQKTKALFQDLNILKAQRRSPAPPLEKLAEAHANRIVAMYVIGEYSYSQIAVFFNMHFTAVGKIVRGAKANSGKKDR